MRTRGIRSLDTNYCGRRSVFVIAIINLAVLGSALKSPSSILSPHFTCPLTQSRDSNLLSGLGRGIASIDIARVQFKLMPPLVHLLCRDNGQLFLGHVESPGTQVCSYLGE
jgi:hypothetical protein